MLAQNFKTATDLGITEAEQEALIKVLGMLERDELVHYRRPAFVCWSQVEPDIPNGFNMETQGIRKPCGTVACIGGWVAFLIGQSQDDYVNKAEDVDGGLHDLYWGHVDADTTPAQAALAVRNYLTDGDPRWNEIVTENPSAHEMICEATSLARHAILGAPTTGNAMNVTQICNSYLTDRDSGFHALRYATRCGYERNILRLIETFGDRDISTITARDMLHTYASWAEGGRVSLAHQLVTQLRIVVSFGATILENDGCKRFRETLASMKFKNAKPRTTWITIDQAWDVEQAAVKDNWLSVALAQALQFDCALRQKDVIGEWVPIEDPEPSTVLSPDGQMKWVRGITREEITGSDDDLILTHKTSKRGHVLTFPLAACALVMTEWYAAPPSGPLIIDPQTDLPFEAWKYRRIWRELATKAGVPATVWNMDSRAGRITERLAAGASLDDTRKLAGHNQVSTTVRYSRNTPEAIERALGPKLNQD